jgi:hypothetical protein
MKKVSKVSAVFIIFLILSCIPSEPTIIGKWTLHTHDDNEVIATFNNDGTYNAEGSTGEQEVSRKYLVTKDTLAINDEGCNENIWGKYKLTFYGDDSPDLKVIYDLCDGRKESVDGITAKRLIGK